MNDKLEFLLGIVAKSINFLMVFNKINTSMGVLIGTVLYGVAMTLKLSIFKDLDELDFPLIYFLCFGVFIMNLPQVIFTKKRKYSKEIDETLNLIEEGVKNGHITRTQAKLLYKELCVNLLKTAIEKNIHEKDSNKNNTNLTSSDDELLS